MLWVGWLALRISLRLRRLLSFSGGNVAKVFDFSREEMALVDFSDIPALCNAVSTRSICSRCSSVFLEIQLRRQCTRSKFSTYSEPELRLMLSGMMPVRS
eukprot:IDg6695t1